VDDTEYEWVRALVGENVRHYRQQLELSQRSLGHQVGLRRESVTRVESGVKGLSIRTLLELSDALDVTPNDLLGYGRLMGKRRMESYAAQPEPSGT